MLGPMADPLDVLLGVSMVAVVLYCLARAFVPALRTDGHRRDLDAWHLVMAAAMAVMLLAGLTLLPALLAIFGRAVFWPSKTQEGTGKAGVWGRVSARIVRHPGPTLVAGLVVFGGLAFAVTASTFAPLLMLGIWWRGLTPVGAVAGLLVGGLGSGFAVAWTLATSTSPGWTSAMLGQPAA